MSNKTLPSFQQVFLTALFVTLLSGSFSVWLSFQKSLSPEQTRVFEICNTTWNMGISAIFGLLGSNAVGLFQSKEKNDEE